MSCEEVRHLIIETLSGSAAPDQRRIVEAHLAGCASCRAEAVWVEETMAALRAVPDIRLRADLWDGFMRDLDTRLAAEQRRPWARLRRWFQLPQRAWVGVAAAAALAVGLGTVFVGPGRIPGAADAIPGNRAAQVMETIGPEMAGPERAGPESVGPEMVSPSVVGPVMIAPTVISPAMVSPQVVEGLPAMDASLAVWKAGLGAGGVTYDLTGGR